MPPELMRFLEFLSNEGSGFDPYQQPGMGVGYGPSFGAGAVGRTMPQPDLSGYRGPARGLPAPLPGPQTEGPVYGGMGYGMTQGIPPGVLALLAYMNMSKGGR